MQEHHKKARQKELQRNKQKRTKERDEKALATKTIKEVKDEIVKLEKDLKRHGNNSNGQHKLARLQKELRLLQEAAAEAKKKADAEAHQNRYQQPQRPLTELDDPRKSVYYDPVMNPYGAPPPGKPRLYHRRYGGVTPNPHEAIVPGEEPPPPPPPPPRDNIHTHGHFRGDSRYQNNNNNRNSHPQQNAQRSHPKQQSQQRRQEGSSDHSQNSPKRQPLHIPPPSKSQSKSDNVQNNTEKPNDEKKPESKNDKLTTDKDSSKKTPAIPSLPAPSAAVQRTMRRNKKKNLADIWASNEEVEYEKLTNEIDLEADDIGTAKAKTKKKKKKKKKKPPLEFYYRDTHAQVQGPYSKFQMRGWIDAGYFPLTTKARTNRMDPDGWVPMGDLPALKEEVPVLNNSVQDRIASLKGDKDDNDGMDSSMQARIEAMRADLMPSSSAPPKTPADENSVQGRIAALRGNANIHEDDDTDPAMQARIAAMRADLIAPANDNEDSVQGGIAALRGNANNDENKYEDIDPSMQARIAAMRADIGSSVPIDQTDEAPKENVSLQDRIASLRKNAPLPAGQEENAESSMSIQDRIAALRKNAPPPPPPPAYPVDTNNELSVQDRIAALRNNAPPPPPPPAYPVDTENEGPSSYPLDDPGVAAYPIDDEEDGVAAYLTYEEEDGVAAYPTSYPDEEDGVVAYPYAIDEKDAVAPYPTDEAYPVAEDLAYPVTDSYSAVEEYGVSEGTQKVVTIDKALVSFVPTNLKKRKAEETRVSVNDHQKKTKSSTKSVITTTASDEKYDKFLKEIDEL